MQPIPEAHSMRYSSNAHFGLGVFPPHSAHAFATLRDGQEIGPIRRDFVGSLQVCRSFLGLVHILRLAFAARTGNAFCRFRGARTSWAGRLLPVYWPGANAMWQACCPFSPQSGIDAAPIVRFLAP